MGLSFGCETLLVVPLYLFVVVSSSLYTPFVIASLRDAHRSAPCRPLLDVAREDRRHRTPTRVASEATSGP